MLLPEHYLDAPLAYSASQSEKIDGFAYSPGFGMVNKSPSKIGEEPKPAAPSCSGLKGSGDFLNNAITVRCNIVILLEQLNIKISKAPVDNHAMIELHIFRLSQI